MAPFGYGPPGPYAPYPGPVAQPYAPSFQQGPSAPAFYPPFGYGPPPAKPGKTFRTKIASAFWGLLFARDLLFLVIVSIWMLERSTIGTNVDFPLALVQEPALLIVTLLGGLGATMTALYCDLTRKHHFIGLAAGAGATAACVTPGLLLGFGVVGVALGSIAVVLHFTAAPEFKAAAQVQGAPAPFAVP
jgi:hypothetical protein